MSPKFSSIPRLFPEGLRILPAKALFFLILAALFLLNPAVAAEAVPPAAPAGDEVAAPAGDEVAAPAGDEVAAPAGDEDFHPGALRFEEILPRESLLFVKFAGTSRMLARAGDLDLFRLFAEPEVKAFLADTLKMLPGALGGRKSSSFPFKEIHSLLEGDAALAVGRRLTLAGEGAVPSLALAVDMGDRKEAFLENLEGLLGTAGAMPGLERGNIEYRGFAIGSIGRPRERLVVCYTTVENLFVATLNRRFLQEIIDCRLDGKPSLSAVPAFSRCLEKAGGEAVRAMAFVHIDPLAGAIEPFCPAEVLDWLDLLGLEGIDALCLAAAVEGGCGRDTLYIDCPGEKTGLLHALAPRPLSAESLGGVPPDAIAFFGFVFDPRLILKEIDGFVHEAFPEHYGSFRGGLAAFKKRTGLDLEGEILASLGRETTFFVRAPRSGGMSMIPDIVATIALDDVAAFEALEAKLFAMAKGSVEIAESSFLGRSIHHVTLPGRGVPVAPAFTVDGGRLVVATTPLALKRYLRWVDSGEPGLTRSEAFTRTMAAVPENACAVEYVDLPRVAGLAYESASPFLANALPRTGLPLDAGLLPLTETITGHLSGLAGYLAADEEGIVLSKRSSFSLGALFTAAVAAIDYLVEKDLIQGLFARLEASVSPEPGPRFRDSRLGEALALMQKEDFAAAERGITAWIDGHPGHPDRIEALLNRGECRTALGRYAEAAADFERAAAEDSASRGLAWMNAARARALMKDGKEAVAALERAITAGYRIFELPAELEGLRGEPEGALFIDMVIEASSCIRDENLDEADRIFTAWLFENPGHELEAWALKNRGECRMKLGRREEAATDLERAAALNADYRPKAFYDIACCKALAGETDEALRFLKEALQAGFDDLDLMDYDPDLDAVRNDPRFKALRWSM